MSGLRNLKFVLAVILAATAVHINAAAAADLTVRLESRVSGHADSMWSSVLHAQTEESGFSVEAYTDNQSLPAPVRKPVSSSSANLVEMPLHDAIYACDEGDINLLPLNRVIPDGATLADYIWNGVQPCGIGHSVWATYAVFDETGYTGESAPVLLQDVFDTVAFPGRRAIKKSPRAIVEWALMNGGVSRRDIYPALSSGKIWPLIEKSLQQIASEIVWVDTDREALELLDKGLVSFAMVSSNNLVRQIAENKKSHRSVDHYGVIWNGAIAQMSVLAVPKNTATAGVIEFLRFITDPIRNLQMSTAHGYAPVGRAQTALINSNYLAAMPVGEQTNDLFFGNDKWWREQGGYIDAMFHAFIDRTLQLETAQTDDNIVVADSSGLRSVHR